MHEQLAEISHFKFPKIYILVHFITDIKGFDSLVLCTTDYWVRIMKDFKLSYSMFNKVEALSPITKYSDCQNQFKARELNYGVFLDNSISLLNHLRKLSLVKSVNCYRRFLQTLTDVAPTQGCPEFADAVHHYYCLMLKKIDHFLAPEQRQVKPSCRFPTSLYLVMDIPVSCFQDPDNNGEVVVAACTELTMYKRRRLNNYVSMHWEVSRLASHIFYWQIIAKLNCLWLLQELSTKQRYYLALIFLFNLVSGAKGLFDEVSNITMVYEEYYLGPHIISCTAIIVMVYLVQDDRLVATISNRTYYMVINNIHPKPYNQLYSSIYTYV